MVAAVQLLSNISCTSQWPLIGRFIHSFGFGTVGLFTMLLLVSFNYPQQLSFRTSPVRAGNYKEHPSWQKITDCTSFRQGLNLDTVTNL